MSPTLTTFLFEAANFTLLAGVLAWLLFKPVRNAIEAQRTARAEQTEQAQAKLAEAERIRSDIEQQRAALDQELQRLRDESRKEAEREAGQIVKQAQTKAREEYEAAEQRRLHLEHAEINRLSNVVATTAAEMVGRLLVQIDSPNLDSALLQTACQRVKTLSAGNSLEPVTVESAKPLSASDRAALESVLGAAAASAEYRVLPELGVGLRIATNHGLVDASSQGLADFAERTLAAEFETGEKSEPIDA